MLIFETTKEESFPSLKKVLTENLDLFTSMNSEFVYIKKTEEISLAKFLLRNIDTTV